MEFKFARHVSSRKGIEIVRTKWDVEITRPSSICQFGEEAVEPHGDRFPGVFAFLRSGESRLSQLFAQTLKVSRLDSSGWLTTTHS